MAKKLVAGGIKISENVTPQVSLSTTRYRLYCLDIVLCAPLRLRYSRGECTKYECTFPIRTRQRRWQGCAWGLGCGQQSASSSVVPVLVSSNRSKPLTVLDELVLVNSTNTQLPLAVFMSVAPPGGTYTAEISGGRWKRAPVRVSRPRMMSFSVTESWNLATAKYCLPAVCWLLTRRVARSMVQMRTPVTLGSLSMLVVGSRRRTLGIGRRWFVG